MSTPRALDLTPLVRPRSIAVIGASPDLSRYPGKILDSLRRHNFAGTVSAVNPKYEEALGFPCYPDIGSVPAPVDVALITLAAARVPAALREAIAAKCRSAIVFASGMAEAGADGEALQEELCRLAIDAGIPVLGPNTLGLINVADGTPLSGAAALQRGDLPAGGVGVITQSGGMMGSLLDRGWAHGVGYSRAFATGNEAVLTVADCLRYLVEDPATRTIALFVEAIRDTPGFIDAARAAARAGKPVFALKVGRSEGARKVAETHTASLAGSATAWDALFHDLGIVAVDDLDELFTAAGMVDSCRPAATRAIALAGPSGGLAGLGADLCARYNVLLADLHPSTLEEIAALQKGFGSAGNPLDITGQIVSAGTWWMTRKAYELLLADPAVGLLVIGQPTSQYADEAARDIVELSRASTKPVVALWTGNTVIAAALRTLRAAGVPTFEQPDLCYRTIRHFLAVPSAVARGARPRAEERGADPIRSRQLRQRLGEATRALPERVAKDLLALYGISVPAGEVVGDIEQARAAAARLGYPIAVKAHGAGLLHKSEHGGVVIGVGGDEQLSAAFPSVRAASDGPEVLIEAMAPAGVELLISVRRDAHVGPILTVALGGVHVEVLGDAATGLVSLREEDHAELLGRLKGTRLLDGLRGQPPMDRAAVVTAMTSLSRLALDAGDLVEVIEINPLIVGEHGAVAVDAVIVPATVASAGDEGTDPEATDQGSDGPGSDGPGSDGPGSDREELM